MKRVLTIAGSDSSGGAGIQADLKTFSAFGTFGMSAITAVTAQNTKELKSIHAVSLDSIEDQIRAVFEDIGVDAVKTGMLLSAEIVILVADTLKELKPPNLVVDPVMIAKSGAELLDPAARDAVATRLFPLATVVTPNLPEAEALLKQQVQTLDDMREAAQAIHAMGPNNVVIKGGHLTGKIVDLLFDGQRMVEFESDRIETKDTHGTGCTLASAMAACLALGVDAKEALACARDYVRQAIAGAPGLGHGPGPLNHGVVPKRGPIDNTDG